MVRFNICACLGVCVYLHLVATCLTYGQAVEPAGNDATKENRGGDAASPDMPGSAVFRLDGSVYLYAEAGTLTVKIWKRDLNYRERQNDMLLWLYSPDRQIAGEALIPDSGLPVGGGMGPVQEAVMETRVRRPGIYRLDVIGRDHVWEVASNAKRHVYYSSGGTIMFRNPKAGIPAEIHFRVPATQFEVSVHAYGKSAVTAVLGDETGQERWQATFTEERKQAQRVTGATPGALWSLSLSNQQGEVKIEGVNFWTDRKDAYFPARDAVSMFTPYSMLLPLKPGGARAVTFTVRNGCERTTDFRIRADAPANPMLTVDLSRTALRLNREESGEVTVEVSLAADAAGDLAESLFVIVEPEGVPELTAFSRLDVKVGQMPATEKLEMPVVQRPYLHENMQFGYLPDYQPNAPDFDLDNRPYIRHRTDDHHPSRGIQVLQDGHWEMREFFPAVTAATPDFSHLLMAAGGMPVKTAFDEQNHLYTLLMYQPVEGSYYVRKALLLYSRDRGEHFMAYPLTETMGNFAFEIEQFTGHNPPQAPPAILLYDQVARPEGQRWARINTLFLYLPRRTADGLDVGEPIRISDNCIGLAAHSGGASALVTKDGKTHILWGEYDPTGQLPGVPTYTATYDHARKKLSDKALIGYGPPVNDVHNSPGITMDSKGYLHAVTGAHGQPFYYAMSLAPNDASAGWTEAVPVATTGRGAAGAQTYLGLVCDTSDTLHVVSRQWRAAVDPYFNGLLYAALGHHTKEPGKAWSLGVPLVVPPLPDYSVYYHKLGIDRKGRIFLSYSYFSVHEMYRNDLPMRHNYRALIFSEDHGSTWKLAETEDFQRGLLPPGSR